MKLLAAILSFFCVTTICAQPTTQPSGEKVVLLLTFGPGEEVYERWGHNMIVIIDKASKSEVGYHYGVFDFDQPNFIGRFVLGRMLYSMGRLEDGEVEGAVEGYIQSDRDVWMQQLDLSQPQIAKLQSFLENNWKEENRNYLYEYYRANCSTKVRDALDLAFDGELSRQWGSVLTDSSYRRYTRMGSADFPLMYTGMSFALSWNVDQPITLWDTAFVPMLLREQLDKLEINGKPVVIAEKQLHDSKHLKLRAQPPQWIGQFLVMGIVLGVAMLLCGFRFSRSRSSSLLLLLIALPWSFLSGVGGLFLIFAWCTDHISAHANQNLLLFSPVSVAMLFVLPAAVRDRPRGKWALPLARIIVLLAILSLAVKISPIPRQWNWEMIALALPAHLGLMLALTPAKARKAVAENAQTKEAKGSL